MLILHPVRRAFTLLEAMIVVLVLGILAAIVIPNFSNVTDDSKSSATQAALAGVRSSVASYRATALLTNSTPYPTLAQLTTLGTVMQQAVPANPFSGLATVQTVSTAQAQARTVVNSGTYGWNYCVDTTVTPNVMYFYANSSSTTTVSNGSGGYLTANQL